MPTAIFLIGVPAAGKSSFRSILPGDFFVASSDDYIDAYAALENKTYNEVFKDTIGDATRHFNNQISMAISHGRMDLVVDRTNMTVASRKKVLSLLPKDWTKVALVFMPKDNEIWKNRLESRPGKDIPHNVLISMLMSYERPTEDEGFERVLTYFS